MNTLNFQSTKKLYSYKLVSISHDFSPPWKCRAQSRALESTTLAPLCFLPALFEAHLTCHSESNRQTTSKEMFKVQRDVLWSSNWNWPRSKNESEWICWSGIWSRELLAHVGIDLGGQGHHNMAQDTAPWLRRKWVQRWVKYAGNQRFLHFKGLFHLYFQGWKKPSLFVGFGVQRYEVWMWARLLPCSVF